MRMFIFKAEGQRGLHAFATDPGGQQLPAKFGPWHAIGVVREDKEPPYNLDRQVIAQNIESQGFALFRKKKKAAAS
jgi:hypothetical protein